MIRFLKWVKIFFWWGTFTILIASLVFVSVLNNNLTNVPRLPYTHNISDDYPTDYRKAVEKSRYSAVLVKSGDLTLRGFSSLSGTYFIANDEPYVITAAHGIGGPCFLTTIIYEDEYYSCDEYVDINIYDDYAIIKLTRRIPNREPIHIPEDLPRGSQWKASYSILNKIIYTGYPNSIGPLTLKGDVVGYAEADYLYVFSYAYGGSSGSGVFATNGKYIGLVTAVDIGYTDSGVEVLENIVLVTPIFKVDWSVVLD
jgi:hypothetical protein